MQQVLNGAQAHMACPTVICRYLFIAWINLLQKPPRSDLIRNGSDRVVRRARPAAAVCCVIPRARRRSDRRGRSDGVFPPSLIATRRPAVATKFVGAGGHAALAGPPAAGRGALLQHSPPEDPRAAACGRRCPQQGYGRGGASSGAGETGPYTAVSYGRSGYMYTYS
jgi:hypothetical protein